MFEVHKNVPQPKAARVTPAPRRKYPFEDMELGDMFFVPYKTKNTLATHASTVGKKLGRKFSTQLIHMVADDGNWELVGADDPGAVLGIGVWRVL